MTDRQAFIATICHTYDEAERLEREASDALLAGAVLLPAEHMRQANAIRSDNSARLVFADWLEERNDPLHEVLRVGCELAILPCAKLPEGTVHPLHPTCSGCDKATALRRRERELQPLIGPGQSTRWDGLMWDRGLIIGCTLQSAILIHRPHILTLHPVRTIRLTDWLGIERSLPQKKCPSCLGSRRMAFVVEGDFESTRSILGRVLKSAKVRHGDCTNCTTGYVVDVEALPWLRRLEVPQSYGFYRLRGAHVGTPTILADELERLFGTLPDGSPRVVVSFWDDGATTTVSGRQLTQEEIWAGQMSGNAG